MGNIAQHAGCQPVGKEKVIYYRNRNKRTPLRVVPIGLRRNFEPPFACCVFFCQVFCAALLWSSDVSYGTMVVRGISLRVLDLLRVCSSFFPPSLGMGHIRTTLYTPLFVCDTDAKRPKNRFPRNEIAVWLFSETSIRPGPCRRLVPSPSRFFCPPSLFALCFGPPFAFF